MAMMKHFRLQSSVVWIIVACWITFLGISACVSPPTFGSDAANGILDLLHFKNGGRFQHHYIASPNSIHGFVEAKTTWWSPGQWFFGFLLNSTGIPLGLSFSLLALAAMTSGVIGWARVYKQLAFNINVVLLSVLVMAFSRFLYSQAMIFTGAAVLEFAAAPWILLLWLKNSEGALLRRLILLFLCIIAGYFVKSSLLILILGLALHAGYRHYVNRRELIPAMAFPLVFFLGKSTCDFLFVGPGHTPFDSASDWMHLANQPLIETVQEILFLLATPLTSGIGIDDYFNYIFHRPGSEILPETSFGEISFYTGVTIFTAYLTWKLFAFDKSASREYKEILFFIGASTIGFLFFAYISEKPISVTEETRHARIFGLVCLPFILRFFFEKVGAVVYIIPLLLCLYGVGSHMSKVNRTKLVLAKEKVALSEITDQAAWAHFETLSSASDYYYVINGDWSFNKSQHNCFFYQDDFRSIERIRNRTDLKLNSSSVTFLLPQRFKSNGKRDAIMGNFVPVDDTFQKKVSIEEFKDWEVILLSVSKKNSIEDRSN